MRWADARDSGNKLQVVTRCSYEPVLKRQAGLTLVELMVATTLSLVLLAGVLVFTANKATYQMQNGFGTLRENGRYAIRQIAADLQLDGYGAAYHRA